MDVSRPEVECSSRFQQQPAAGVAVELSSVEEKGVGMPKLYFRVDNIRPVNMIGWW